MKKQKITSWGEESMELKHLTPKQRKKAVEVLGEENIKAIDDTLTKAIDIFS